MKEANYKNYLVAVLLLILAFNYVDRMALGLLLQEIKVDLDLSDTQLGFLTGIAFALFYSSMGIPIARWADRGNRVTIIAVTTALWSAAVALCGSAATFTQLLLIRIGVAVGEAGCLPPAHSLIADYFSRADRPRAVARYMLGAPLSLLIGYLLAGWLNELYGWRTTFVLIGLPGIGLALIARFTLREPRLRNGIAIARRHDETPAASSALQPSMREVFTTLWRNLTFRQLLICFSIMSLFGHGVAQWKPAFFVRSFGLQTAELGTWFAAIYGIGGLLGTYLGGRWATRHAANNEALQLRAMALAYLSFGVISVCIYASSHASWAFFFLALATVGSNLILGPLFATIQTLVPERMRAMSIALLYLFANLVGMGLGPLAVGTLSDLLRPLLAEESLRYSLLVLCPGYAWASWHLWRASTTVTADLQARASEHALDGDPDKTRDRDVAIPYRRSKYG